MLPLDKRLALLACAGLLVACQRSEPDDEPAPTTASADVSVLPVAEPPLDRQALLTAVMLATSDFALGRDDTERQRPLDGRPFELRLRFGCDGDEEDTRRWTYDERERVLRINVEPEIAAQTPLIAGQNVDGLEAVEGFWIRQPWVLDAACPAGPPAAAPTDEETDAPAEAQGATDETDEDAPQSAPPAAMRVGIAQFFTPDDSRLRRRDSRAYEATARLTEGETPSPSGYDFVLSGRLSRLPNGKTISCIANGSDSPPACVVAAEFHHVSIARPDGEIVAEWSRG